MGEADRSGSRWRGRRGVPDRREVVYWLSRPVQFLWFSASSLARCPAVAPWYRHSAAPKGKPLRGRGARCSDAVRTSGVRSGDPQMRQFGLGRRGTSSADNAARSKTA